MSSTLEVNLGNDASFRMAPTKDGDRPVVNFRGFVNNRVSGEDGYEDNGGYWIRCSIWLRNEQYAERLAEMLLKGVAVIVSGTLRQKPWKNENTGKEGVDMVMNVKSIGINPIGIEDVTYTDKN